MSVIDPEIFKTIRRIQIRTSRTVTDVLAGAYHSAFKGRGMEFEDVREYQPGDEVRAIDWNVTARTNYPHVKNFREERELTNILVVDVSASSNFKSFFASKRKIIAEIGALLAFSAIQNNDKVGLVLFSDIIETYIPPSRGLQHVLRVIRELLVFEPQSKGTNIAEALSFVSKVQKRRGVCFLISDFIAPQSKTQTRITAKRHDLTAISVSDPLEFEIPNVGLLQMQDLESGQDYIVDTSDSHWREEYKACAEKRLQDQQKLMRSCGAGFIDIRTDESYGDALWRYFKLKEKRR